MPAKRLKAAPDPNQHARFIETARALGCDEDEAAFDEKLKVVARHKRSAQHQHRDDENAKESDRSDS